MKKLILSLSLLLSTIGLQAQALEQIKIGDALPMKGDFFENIKGGKTTLENLKKDNGLVLVFTSNKCPFVTAWEKDYPEYYAKATSNKVGFVLVNSNEKFRDQHESKANSVAVAKDKGYDFVPQLIDKSSKLANALAANTTPHVFFFDKNLNLIYKGSFDDRFENKEEKVTQHYFADAVDQHIGGKAIAKTETRNIGCSIKRVVK